MESKVNVEALFNALRKNKKKIREIFENYDVDAIHIDDYFYPESNSINDKALYEQYKETGGKLSLNDWRRENVNVLISSVHSLTKAGDINMIFSISPSADIKKCKNKKKWKCMRNPLLKKE